ncbi:5-formyltetrahydrofolate cyclo-ligase [Rhodophyticola porphyridii]|uniref:5-formyltetrahydrofolate cyclo-ligase n=1 Tax=Rhodophyticola porphyridii TaxID=1852017 RepID=A0A3L9Y679_9RHOB|nr:5-formyltetrahydrofolate cyclo-ligase [Rhodophyticola porphyridii]RMA41626.1 5-formyltetrahydrofolate cyclo-ligase [Rhodophyticola porphyridii]
MTLSEQKAALRRDAYAARQTAFAEGHGLAATAALLAEIGPVSGHVISGYMPIRTELDPIPAMTALAARNLVCVPVIAAKGKPLRFREWTPATEMVPGPFGARIPADGDWLEPDILIVPLVGFDRAANRLGYGGGFYDRTLARLRANGPVRALGFAFAAQQLPPLPVEPTDQPLDAVVTETGTIRPPEPPLP